MNADQNPWLSAMRPRTLVLTFACIGMGIFLAAGRGVFDPVISFLCILTTALLQILTDFANDYGDTVHGADSDERVGPQRAVQAGVITQQQMRRAMLVTATLAAISGILLVGLSLGFAQLPLALLFIALGGAAIFAAITYTAGSNPYGYMGLGDLAVFLFFGLLAVLGTYFLQAKSLEWQLVLPAISCGVFAVGVLNINNIRDIASDKVAGKNSIPVRIGDRNARLYHWALIGVGIVAAALFVLFDGVSVWNWLFLLSVPLLLKNGLSVWQLPQNKLDPMLKQLSLATLAFVVTFGIGQLLG